MPNFKTYGLKNFRTVPEVKTRLSEDEKLAIEVVGSVLPFRINNYLIDELINWDNLPDDPIFQLTFPQRGMLSPEHFSLVQGGLRKNDTHELQLIIDNIRDELNPNPAGQMERNVPMFEGQPLKGIQHKYDDTVLFFPSQGQTCHAYCMFCFRWPQFIGDERLKFHMREVASLVAYLSKNPQVSDVLFTGGDPMVMNANNLDQYISPLLDNTVLPNISTIRIGTKSLSYWPYKFTSDTDSDNVLRLFEKIVKAGKHLAIMAHFNHPVELRPKVVQDAIRRILSTGAQIRTQSPIMNHINNCGQVWHDLWKEQIKLGCIPYYMFIPRDTGAQDYFSVPLVQALRVFNGGCRDLGLARTVRGPCMSSDPGKIHILGIVERNREQLMVLKFLRARRKEWVDKIFFARFNDRSIWLDDLAPEIEGARFFFEEHYSKV